MGLRSISHFTVFLSKYAWIKVKPRAILSTFFLLRKAEAKTSGERVCGFLLLLPMPSCL